uniref:Uncharacterized protein n=1 Tax=viral metagenome TaxID=1070528 RepID=A0A6C0LEG7_9ZZZZ
MEKEIINLRSLAVKNYKQIKKLQRLIYLLQNNIKVYKGKNGGIFYMIKNSKIYI